MRILSVFDTACIGGLISDQVIQHQGLDPFGYGQVYEHIEYPFGSWESVIGTSKNLVDRFDFIILHDYAQFLHYFPTEKTAIMYHGAMLRSVYGDIDIDKGYPVLLSTPDLLKWRPDGFVLGTAVDRKHFFPCAYGGSGRISITNRRQSEQVINDLPDDVEIRIRDGNIIPYRDMPRFLSQYDEYVEMRHDYLGNPMKFPSTTALQALSLGLTAEIWGEKITKFPEQYDSNVVRERLISWINNRNP